jgi:hypothetical protein
MEKKKYIKNFESFKNSKTEEPINEEILGAIGRAIGGLFKKGKELINKAKGGKEVEAIYQKYLKLIQDQFASQAKVNLNILATKESIQSDTTDKIFEADVNSKLAVDTLKQKKVEMDQIVQKMKAMALKEMDNILKKYGGATKNPQLDLIIQSKKDEFDLAYLNAKISYLEQAGDTTMVAGIKSERNNIATKIQQELDKASKVVPVDYKVGDLVIYLLKDKEQKDYDPKKKPEDQKNIVGVHKIDKIEGDKFTLLDDDGKEIIKMGAELIGKSENNTNGATKKSDFKVGDDVIYLLKGKSMVEYNELTDEEKAKPTEGRSADLVGVHKIEKIEGDKVTMFDKNGDEFTKKLSEIISKTDVPVAPKADGQEELVKKLGDLKTKKPEDIKKVSSYVDFINNDANKDKVEEIEKIISGGERPAQEQ